MIQKGNEGWEKKKKKKKKKKEKKSSKYDKKANQTSVKETGWDILSF